jgi:hypothetical protein
VALKSTKLLLKSVVFVRFNHHLGYLIQKAECHSGLTKSVMKYVDWICLG